MTRPLALLALLSAVSLHAQTAAKAAPPPAIPTIATPSSSSSNGLTLIVHEDHKAPIVAVNVWYHMGSKNEKPGKTGFAHLYEHLMFGGSEHHPESYLKALEPVGATELNGTTNEDRTNYFQDVPISALDRVLWLESDRMGYMVNFVDQKLLDLQRGVVQNEKRQGENEPYGKMFNTITENTYPKGHPYSWSVIGSMDDLNAASLEDVRPVVQGWLRGRERDVGGRRRREHGGDQAEGGALLRRDPAGPAAHRGPKSGWRSCKGSAALSCRTASRRRAS